MAKLLQFRVYIFQDLEQYPFKIQIPAFAIFSFFFFAYWSILHELVLNFNTACDRKVKHVTKLKEWFNLIDVQSINAMKRDK